MIAQWDSAGNDIGFNNGFDAVKLSQPVSFPGDSIQYFYKYEMKDMLNGWQYLFVVTAFDKGDKTLQIPSLESSYTQNEKHVFTGTTPHELSESNKVGVYPNPYYTTAAWDAQGSRGKKIYFYNLPQDCELIIYTLSGDVVAKIKHHADTYRGEDIQWFQRISDPSKNVMSGGEHAWDLLTESKTQIQQGVYLFSVRDLNTGAVQEGKFAIMK